MTDTCATFRVHGFLLALAVLALSFPVLSQGSDIVESGNKLLREGRILYDNLQYREALKRFKAAIKVPGTTRKEYVEIYRYMGFVYVVQEQKKYAERAFELLLKLEPAYEMNPLLTSPKILNIFNEVKAAVEQKNKVIMQHTPLTVVAASERIEIKAYLVDLHQRLRQVTACFRLRGGADFSRVQLSVSAEAGKEPGAATYVGFIPFIWSVSGESELQVEYYLAGFDKSGNLVSSVGSPDKPMGFRINLQEGKLPEGAVRTSLWESWWFWTLLGVGVAGLSAGGYFLAAGTGGENAPTTGEAVLVIR